MPGRDQNPERPSRGRRGPGSDRNALTFVPPDAEESAGDVNTDTRAESSESGGPRETAFDPPIDPKEIGTLGPHRIVRQLGRGGMGAVYLAIDTRLNRKLALKVMLPEFAADPAAKERFLREARAAAQVSHDNVVTVYEADERNGVPYIAMQFLQGYPLDEYLRRKGRPEIPQIVRLVREAAAGLAAAHRIGLVHRDIKPANLWLEAPRGRVKVLDFGLAKPLDADVEMTRSGVILGSPAYMSPEQARGQKLDARTDLFSLGAVLYQLCTGRLPFEGSSVVAVLTALAADEPRPVRELNPAVPAPLDELIHQLLAKDPTRRPATADEVVQRLSAIAGQFARPGGVSQSGANSLSVTAVPTADPFADFDLTIGPSLASRSRTATGQRKQLWVWLAAAAALVIVAIVGTAGKITMRSETGRPASGTGTRERREPSNPPATPPRVAAKKPGLWQPAVNPAADAHRTAAIWVLSVGGTLRANGEPRDIAAEADLPAGRFALTQVSLANRPVTDADLVNLKSADSLSRLILTNTSVKGEGLAHLRNLPGLTELWLKGTQITDASLVYLVDLKALKWLTVAATGIGDTGLPTSRDAASWRSWVWTAPE